MKRLYSLIRNERFPLTWISILVNLTFALVHLFQAAAGGGHWHTASTAYFGALGLLRLAAMTAGRNKPDRAVKMCGGGMLFLAVVMTGMTYLAVRQSINPVYEKAYMIAYAGYSFSLLTIAVISTVKAMRRKDQMLSCVRNISLAAALGGLFAMERTMLGTFGIPGGNFAATVEMLSGMCAAAVTAVIGLHMLVRKNYI